MTDQIREQVSALLDGELPGDEMGLLVRRLERDAELRRAFGNYALIGEALRAPGAPLASPSFAARVNAAIGAPDGATTNIPLQSIPARRRANYRRPLAASAIAASAAIAGVLLFRPFAGPTPIAANSEPENRPVATNFTLAASPTPAQSQRLAGYMVVHSQFATPMVRRNVWSGLLAADPGLKRVSYETGEAN